MSVIVIIVAASALFCPPTFLWATKHVSALLGIAMFGMGMTLRAEDFKLVLKRPKDVLLGALCQFTIMPLLAFVIVKAFGLPPELAVGVILVGTCPGGTSSNVMTYLSKGDVALSVTMTITTTILAPFVTPFLTWLLAGQWIEVSMTAMFLSIVKVVLVPIGAGVIINMLFKKAVSKVTPVLPLVSVTAIVLIVGGVVSANSEKILETGVLMMAVVILHNVLGYLVGYLVGKVLRLNLAKKKAISIEVGMQNSGLATSLAMAHFTPAAAIAGAMFSVWHNISGSLLANYFVTKTED